MMKLAMFVGALGMYVPLRFAKLLYRGRDDVTAGPKSKACREKMRRDKLNDRYDPLCCCGFMCKLE